MHGLEDTIDRLGGERLKFLCLSLKKIKSVKGVKRKKIIRLRYKLIEILVILFEMWEGDFSSEGF